MPQALFLRAWNDLDPFETFSSPPIWIAYFAITGQTWQFSIAYLGGLFFVSSFYAYTGWGLNLKPLRHWMMLLMELSLFFVLSQGVSANEMQPDGFQSSYMYIPIAMAWLSMCPGDKLKPLREPVFLGWLSLAKSAVYLTIVFYGVTRQPSGKTPDIQPYIRWPILILLPVLYITTPQPKIAVTTIASRLLAIALATGVMLVQELRRPDASISSPIDFRSIRDVTAVGSPLNYYITPFLRAVVLMSAGYYAAEFVGSKAWLNPNMRSGKNTAVVFLSTTTLLACVVANSNTHALLWAALVQFGMFLWDAMMQ